MPLTNEQKIEIQDMIRHSIRRKFESYTPESAGMPFHTKLLGRDRLALYSFIHSLNTNFGKSIFEPIAGALAKSRFEIQKVQVRAGNKITIKVQERIQDIMDKLSTAQERPNKRAEVEYLRDVCQDGEIREVKPTLVDVFLIDEHDERYLIDIKTAKPNKGGFKEFKRTLLEWVGVVLFEEPKAKVHTLIAIPYNPYEPKPYARWTMTGMLDLKEELKVASEFWDFLGGEGAYEDLLSCFEEVGIGMKKEIDDYFSKFNRR